ncbi:hypothetical protein EVAR_91991_1 [Eumeta japonica]|uniref:Uncharacterized protein n=1 Tax=Eumeta variegata TaxID=151549 RepID=A0A4C1TLA3_EUMVA|nr:hypothetical protein EVAR_91991_1 [Eumeta japonica]
MDERVEGDGILCAELVVKFNSFRPSLHSGIGIPPKGELRLTVWWIPAGVEFDLHSAVGNRIWLLGENGEERYVSNSRRRSRNSRSVRSDLV